MNDQSELDPLYVAARRVLLDALAALAPHGKAFIVVGGGAQAVYLRTGSNDVAITIAPYTTDADLALDPALLGDEPLLEDSMRAARASSYGGTTTTRPSPGYGVRPRGSTDATSSFRST